MTLTSTVRWHRSGCSKPGVIVEDGVPQCHSCGATSSILVAQLVAQNQIKGGDIHLPAEAPLGEANLWWPPCVPYRKPQEAITSSSMPSDNKEGLAEPPNRESEPSSVQVSHIYPRSLDSDHFRLIYLGSSDDVSPPIHIHLEEYPLDDHPEYETVSYVWGGEIGDSTLCKPVYVGRFWDVILATRNCSALLHYLRRRRVCRVIWVDAICINQADNAEKPAQISRMGDIYANCERVVAYLGEDLVTRPSGKAFRPRFDFGKPKLADGTIPGHEERSAQFLATCAASAGMSRDQLFQRQYLTRIWIVQELSLSKKAILPLGDLDILCDQKDAVQLILRDNQERLGRSAVVGKSLIHLLEATSHCHASDPRDKIYGLLGLFEPRCISQKLVANYSIPWRDCWVGTAAYIILVEKDLMLLAHAGHTRPEHLPSWVPDVENARSWLPDLGSKIHEETLRNSRYKNWAAGNWATQLVMYSVNAEEFRVHRQHNWVQWRAWKQSRLEPHLLVYSGALYTSLESASIRSSDGALQLQALRVFDGSCRLKLETEENGITSVWVRGPSTVTQFRTMGLKQPDALYENYWFYLIDSQAPDSYSGSGERRYFPSDTPFLALATMLPEKDSSVVTLHDCCVVFDIRIYSMEHLEFRPERIIHMTNEFHSLYWVLDELRPVPIKDYMALPEDWVFTCMFPSWEATTRDIFSLLISLAEAEGLSHVSPAVAHAISIAAESICPDFDPIIRDNYFHLTIKNKEMLEMWNYRKEFLESGLFRVFSQLSLEVSYSYPFVHGQAEWTRIGPRSQATEWDLLWCGHKLPVTFRFPLDLLRFGMEATTLYTAICYAREFSNLLNENWETFLSRSPAPEDQYIFLNGWGQSLIEELRLMWKLERITIV